MTQLLRKPDPIDAWHLVDAAAMMTAFTALNEQGWRGGITAGDNGVLRLELNADNPIRQIIATIGDWLVDDIGLRLISDADCVANYDEVTE